MLRYLALVAAIMFSPIAAWADEQQLVLYGETSAVQLLAGDNCPSAEHPLVLNARLPEQLQDKNLVGLVWTYYLLASTSSGARHCELQDGDRVAIAARVRGVHYANAVVTFYERPGPEFTSMDPPASLPAIPASPLDRFLEEDMVRRFSVDVAKAEAALVADGVIPAGLEWNLADKSSVQRALSLELVLREHLSTEEEALAEFMLARVYWNIAGDVPFEHGATRDAFRTLWGDHMRRAALLSHPVALIEAPESQKNYDAIWSALVHKINGDPSGLPQIGKELAENQGMIFQSVALGYERALQLVDLAAAAGVELTASGIALAELPTEYDIENALNHKLKVMADTGELLLKGVFVLPVGDYQCDGVWCRAPIATMFRFSRPDSMSCEKAGPDAATCDVRFRLVIRVDMDSSDLIDFGNLFMDAITDAAAISATLAMARTDSTWEIVGPIETY